MDIGRCFSDAMAVYKKNFVTLVVAAILFDVLSVISLLVLMGPLSGGIARMTLNSLVRDDRVVDLGDLFRTFHRFFSQVGLFFVTFVPVLIGLVLCLVPGLILSTIWFFAFFLLVDKNLGVFDSMRVSRYVVSRKGFADMFVLLVIVFLLTLGASSVPYLGFIVSWFVSPLAWLAEASAYVQQVREDQGDLADVL